MEHFGTLQTSDLSQALRSGWRDFRQAPLFGLFFSAFYVICGGGLSMLGAGTFAWTLMLSLGFPLVAPFAAVGLYEVSRRLEQGEELSWPGVLSVVWSERGRQTPWIGAIVLIIFLFWSFFAHMLFALFLGSMSLINVTSSWEMFASANGAIMLAVQVIIGAGVAFFVFTITVLALPHLLAREVDFVTAMLASMQAVGRNFGVMILWAAMIAVVLLASLLPLFLGLFVSLPVLGHATWHLYRRATQGVSGAVADA